MNVSEFRLMLYPKDFATVREFYEQTLGFSIVHEWDRPESKGVMFQVGSTTLELLWPLEDGKQHYGDGAGFSLSLAVDDVDAQYERLKERVEIAHEIRDNPWGDRSFRLVDPEGLKISLFTKFKDYEK